MSNIEYPMSNTQYAKPQTKNWIPDNDVLGPPLRYETGGTRYLKRGFKRV